jgi:hypothetical protein
VDEIIENVAEVCHEANAAFCRTIGDDSQPTWAAAPEWQKESARLGVRLHMTGDHGPEKSHESWMEQKIKDGWVFGAAKDPAAKTHPCLVPYDQLDSNQQMKSSRCTRSMWPAKSFTG